MEKGRGVGGRMATRRMNGALIDHGAQFYTTRDCRLQSLNNDWIREGRATPWYDRVPGKPEIPSDMRYRGTMGMTGPAKSLTQNCTLALNFFVERIEKKNKWKVIEREGDERVLQADHIVITIPPVQMLELFERSRIDLGIMPMNRLQSIRHTHCLAILGLLDRPSRLIHPGAITHPAQNIDWLSDNQVKGISPNPAITLHTSAEFSDRHWEFPAEEWSRELLEVSEELLGARVISWVSHRWGFAKPLTTFGATHHDVPELSLTLAGDGFGGERVERAAISGMEAADAILSRAN